MMLMREVMSVLMMPLMTLVMMMLLMVMTLMMNDDDAHDDVYEESDVNVIDVNHLEPNVTYVMVKYEGSVFPGFAKVACKVSVIVSCMKHVPSMAHKSLWKLPEKEDELIIYHIYH